MAGTAVSRRLTPLCMRATASFVTASSIRSRGAERPVFKTGHFGSFQSSDVEVLVRTPHASLAPPDAAWPRVNPELLPTGLHDTEALRQLFLLDLPAWTFLNHGAFGATLHAAHDLATAWRLYQERQPLHFFDRVLLPELARRLHETAAFVGCAAHELTFVPNATAGLNAAVAALAKPDWNASSSADSTSTSTSTSTSSSGSSTTMSSTAASGARDALLLDLAYGSVKTMVGEAVAQGGGAVETVHVPLPVAGPNDIIERVTAALSARAAAGRSPPAFAVFDHVTSNSGLVLPVERLAAVCAAAGVPVLVDGAHAPLQLPLDLTALGRAGVTYYAANAHKWLASAKSVGLLWGVDDTARTRLRPLYLSHGFGHGFVSDFLWDGCRDYAPALALPACYAFWEACGGAATVRAHTHALAKRAATALAQRWGTGGLAPAEMHANMVLVAVPRKCGPPSGTPAVYAHAQALQNWLYAQRIEVPVKALGGRLYVRLSAHVYNTDADYERLGQVLDSHAANGVANGC